MLFLFSYTSVLVLHLGLSNGHWFLFSFIKDEEVSSVIEGLTSRSHILKCVNTLYSVAGDNESVLLLLLIPRLSFKTELLQSQLRQKASQAII